jgi:hypothetical protein
MNLAGIIRSRCAPLATSRHKLRPRPGGEVGFQVVVARHGAPELVDMGERLPESEHLAWVSLIQRTVRPTR